MVLLGEVGGREEYLVAEAIKDGRITKPLVAWCCGTAAEAFDYEVWSWLQKDVVMFFLFFSRCFLGRELLDEEKERFFSNRNVTFWVFLLDVFF